MSSNLIGKKFPEFNLHGVTKDDHTEFPSFSNQVLKGTWSVLFYIPLAFTFVCPTEVVSFNQKHDAFRKAGCNVYVCSVDSQFALMEWRKQLGNIHFPMLSDLARTLSLELEILNPSGIPYRATYIIDPEGIVQHVSINNLNVGRSADEVLRLVQAFKAGGLRQCNWQPGEPGIN